MKRYELPWINTGRVALAHTNTKTHCCLTSRTIETGDVALTLSSKDCRNAWVDLESLGKFISTLEGAKQEFDSVDSIKYVFNTERGDVIAQDCAWRQLEAEGCVVCGEREREGPITVVKFTYRNTRISPWVHIDCSEELGSAVREMLTSDSSIRSEIMSKVM